MTTTAQRPAIRHAHPHPAAIARHATACDRIESVVAAGGVELVDYLAERTELHDPENTEAMVKLLGDSIDADRRAEMRTTSQTILLENSRTAMHVLGQDSRFLTPSDMVALLDYYRRLRLLA